MNLGFAEGRLETCPPNCDLARSERLSRGSLRAADAVGALDSLERAKCNWYLVREVT